MSLSGWSQEPSSQQVALHKLQQLPRERHGVRPPPPLVIDDKDAYHAAVEKTGHHGSLGELIKRAPVVDVPLKDVHTIQRSVNPDRVAQYLRHPGTNAHQKNGAVPVDHPIIVQARGTRWLHDGHTRSTAAILKGGSSVRARFVDLDK